VTKLLVFILGVGPAVLWLAYFYRKDRFEPEPLRLILRAFLAGAFCTVPAGFLNALAETLTVGRGATETASAASLVVLAFAFVGPVEEALKLLAVRWTVYREDDFDEPIDGLIYAASAALGFAGIENIGYIVAHGHSVMIGRTLLSTLGHVLFAAPWGLALGLRRCVPGYGVGVVVGGYAVGALLHGIYDGLVFQQRFETTAIFLMVAFPLMIVFMTRAFRRAVALSRYRATRQCALCSSPLGAGLRFCSTCGADATLHARCPSCRQAARAEALFCHHCGHPFEAAVETQLSV
jgi:RsiW-degrading membrane proteinase PrsW (M82 family)